MSWIRGKAALAIVLSVLSVAGQVAAEQGQPVANVLGSSRSEKVRVHSVRVEGNLEEKAARATLEKAIPRFQKCYKRSLETSSFGVVELRLLVRPNGQVAGATIEDPAEGSVSKLQRCVANRAMDLRFPRRKNGHATVRASVGRGLQSLLLGALSAMPASSIIQAAPGAVPIGVLSGGGGSGSKIPTIVGGLPPGKNRPRGRAQGQFPVVQGALSRDVVKRVVHRHVNQVRYCYEKQLVQNPNLAGRIMVRFVITKTGAVSAASVSSTTLKNVPVESCVVRVVRRMQFPQPQGGGIVVVRYPFRFKSNP